MGGEKTLFMPHNQGDYGASQSAVFVTSAIKNLFILQALTHLPTGGLSSFCCNFNFVCSRYDFLLGLTDLPARSLVWKERLNMLVKGEIKIIKDGMR